MTLALEIDPRHQAAAGRRRRPGRGARLRDARRCEARDRGQRRARLKPLFAGDSSLAAWHVAIAAPDARRRRRRPRLRTHSSWFRPHLGHGPDVLVATPPWYTREQLALPVGVAQEAGLRPVGLVDAESSLARRSSPRPRAYCSSSSHCTTQTLRRYSITRATCAARASRSSRSMAGLRCSSIARDHFAAFVRKTRFDALHQAATEQRLCDGPPRMARRRRRRVVVVVEVASSEARSTPSTGGRRFHAGRGSIYDEYVRALDAPDRVAAATCDCRSASASGVPRGDPGLRGDAPAARRRGARVRGRPAQERAWTRARAAPAGPAAGRDAPRIGPDGGRAVRAAADARRAGQSRLWHRTARAHARVGGARRPACAASRARARHLPQPLHAVRRGWRRVGSTIRAPLRHVRGERVTGRVELRAAATACASAARAWSANSSACGGRRWRAP